MDDLSEHQIAMLLRAADRPRTLDDGERARLERRLGLRDPDRPRPSAAEVLAVSATEPSAGDDRHRRRLGGWTATCAAAIVLVLVAALAMVDRTPDPAPSQAPTSVVPPAPSAWCTNRVGAVVDAVERWRGVENWAWATGGVPDLGELVESALVEPAPSGDQDAAAVGDAAGVELRARLDAAAESADFREAAQLRLVAVDAALDTLTTVGRTIDPACPIGDLAAARDSD